MNNQDAALNLQPGNVIAGRYEVIKCLGSGSMGLVYACRDRELPGRIIAVKVLFPEVAADQVSVARFRNEIVASYGVSHPNVVRSYEFIREADLTAYSMEYIEGGTLLESIESAERMDINEMIRVMIEVCSGVQAIHDAGIVHRDLKPENILITKNRAIKITDFGIARTDQGPKLTEHGGVVGTIDYVSPEYMLESVVDWRSDIYALGVMMYELITGQAPFQADSVYAAMTKRLSEDPAPPSKLRPECSKELDEIALKAMSRDPETRFQSAAEMGLALMHLYNGEKPIGSSSHNMVIAHGTAYQGPTVEDDSTVLNSANEPMVVLEEQDSQQSVAAQEQDKVEDTLTVKEGKEMALKQSNQHTIEFEGVQSSQPKETAITLSDTQTIEPEILDIASYYHAQAERASSTQLQSVMERNSVERTQFNSADQDEEGVIISSSALGGERMSKLRSQVGNSSYGNSMEKILFGALIVFAILAGIAGGYYLVQLLTPDSGSKNVLQTEVQDNTAQESVDGLGGKLDVVKGEESL